MTIALQTSILKSSIFNVAVLSVLFLIVLIRTAWLSDDALISLRTVLNLTHGFGLTYNIAERVQTFTHPLWLLLVTGAYVVIGNIYYAAFVVAIVTSLAVFWVVVRHAASEVQAWLAAGLLLFSRAFVDYSTSGLENPLSNLLVVASILVFARATTDRRQLTTLTLLASLLYLTRPDDILLIAPMLIAAAMEVRRVSQIAHAVIIGVLPAVAWTLFSLLYYGFPFPNTAYAKLATGISQTERWRQGWLYVIDAVDRDPLTVMTMAVAVLAAVALRTRGARAVAAGVLLHVLYVVWIGGDFMAGRFLAVPFVASVMVLTRLVPMAPIRPWVPAYVTLVAAAIASSMWPLRSDGRVGGMESLRGGIVDERAVYFPSRSLLRADRRTFITPDWPSNDDHPRPPYVLDTCGLMGWAGIEWGPYTHLLDECALADPLLARLPAVWNESWRSGHFRRMIPEGYRESLRTNTNQIQDPGLASYYNELRTITRSTSLWSGDRLRAIGRMNRGAFSHLINRTFYRYGGEVTALGALGDVKPDGTPRESEGNRAIVTELAVTVEDRPGRRYLDIAVDSDDVYRLSFVKGDNVVSVLQIDPIPEHRRTPGLISHVLDVPPRARAHGFDTIVILPGRGDNKFAIGHLLLDGVASTDAELARRVAARDARR